MAATRTRLSWRAPLLAGLAALLAAGCGANRADLDPEPELEPEQVAIGYGTRDSRDVTGAVASIDAERDEQPRVVRVEEMLEGRVAGVQVMRTGNGYSVRVRGGSTLIGDGEPLFVVDGVPLSNPIPGQALAGINPADVARIDVLKDAGAAAIYGSKGGNGVILITTRRQ
jgi:TonB-dependent SusC/RagA subfamily outer membrane receptor